jgi:hypothetical protein
MLRERRKRHAFQPCVNGARLEDRVVLSHVSMSAIHASRTQALAARAAQGNAEGLPRNTYSRAELLSLYRTQFQSAGTALKQVINSGIAQIYANGRPSQTQLNALQTLVLGAVDATTFRVASQVALLPATQNFVGSVQNQLLQPQGGSLAGRLNGIIGSPRFNQSPGRLRFALGRTIDAQAMRLAGQMDNYLNTTPVFRLSTNSAGQLVGPRQFMAQQVINQFINTYATLAQAFPKLAQTALFANGATTTTPDVQGKFNNQVVQALNIVNYQLASDLAFFPGAKEALAPSLRQAFFAVDQSVGAGTGANTGTGTNTGAGSSGPMMSAAAISITPQLAPLAVTTATGPSSFFSGLLGLPTTSSLFFPASTGLFNNTFGNVTGTLGNFFGITPTTPFTLPTTTTSFFTPTFSSFGNGFNTGFGNGFLGFGTTPFSSSTFFNPFSSGFFGMTSGLNSSFGVTPFGGSSAFGTLGSGLGTIGLGGVGLTGTGAGGTFGTI